MKNYWKFEKKPYSPSMARRAAEHADARQGMYGPKARGIDFA